MIKVKTDRKGRVNSKITFPVVGEIGFDKEGFSEIDEELFLKSEDVLKSHGVFAFEEAKKEVVNVGLDSEKNDARDLLMESKMDELKQMCIDSELCEEKDWKGIKSKKDLVEYMIDTIK